MRKRNILGTVLLVASIGAFYAYNKYQLKNTDILGPSIQMSTKEIAVSVYDDEDALMQGITATDQKDGDVTDSIVIENISEFTSQNTRRVDYAAFDSDNHVTKGSRSLIYTDYQSPHFSIEEPLRFPVTTWGDVDILGNVHASDCIDGDISDSINFTEDSHINVDIASDYRAVLTVTNSAGDTQELPVTVTIYDGSEERMLPQIELSKYLIYTKVGDKIDLKSNIKGITYRGEEYQAILGDGIFGMDEEEYIKLLKEAEEKDEEIPLTVSIDKFHIKKNIDYKTPGVYEVTYIIDDTDGNRGKAILTVVVEGEKDGAE